MGMEKWRRFSTFSGRVARPQKNEIKWRKADREREKKQRKKDKQSRKEELALRKM